MKIPFEIFLILAVSCTSVNGYRILTLLIGRGKSHFDVFHPMLEGLVAKNHNLTLISYFSLSVPENENYTQIILNNSTQGTNIVNIGKIRSDNIKWEAALGMSRMKNMAFVNCNLSLSNPVIKKFIGTTTDYYDLIILEFFLTDCFFPLAKKFRAPVIGLSSCPILPWINDRYANVDNPSYIPNALYVYSNKMNFWERMENFLVTQYQKYYHDIFIRENDEYFARQFFNDSIESFGSLIRNYTSLLLVNTHSSLLFARPLVPAVVEIGGIHLPKETRKLPENIEKFINESTHGVIYFSLGSMIKGHTFPEEKRQEFLKAFARLPQRVLWKWENETMPGKPDNIMIQKWMPQFDILSHPNVKAFISHAGLLGTTEAVHCGVPMLLMPQYGDQHTNARAVEANGGGIVLYLKDVTEEKVYESLKTLMSPEFTAKTKALSERFRDRPMSPMDTAIYWIEYVARHKGAPHLKTAAVDMPLYQYLLLDVIGFLALIFLAFSYIVYKIIRLIYRAIFSKNKVKKN